MCGPISLPSLATPKEPYQASAPQGKMCGPFPQLSLLSWWCHPPWFQGDLGISGMCSCL